MADQTRSMETILADKARLEKELADARTKGGGASPEVAKFQEKIQTLEGKLAEYSVIEDDLANLKRLQQENSQLRAALASKGGTVAAPSVSPPVAAPVAAPATAIAAIAKPAVAEAPSFEGLVDHVEASLQAETLPTNNPLDDLPGNDPMESLRALAATPPAAAAPTTPVAIPANATSAKSDEDLVAEFEKMLNS